MGLMSDLKCSFKSIYGKKLQKFFPAGPFCGMSWIKVPLLF